ncbi:tail tape measure protein [Streptococcus dysgalactiae]|uniref:Tail tape measure protein n=1 Tax=Streptococcus dysgalactiae subsp. dysgalactiae TaxID=99822 RepID=A0A9X7S7L9_STRDY|nr:tail tape measure protein [Streptococcus dysgalactiae]QGH01450.1 tail tape measure protein [Streptococcus dysgalactiae subsp. dysgalactiae]
MADGKVTIAVDLDGKKAQGDINSLKASLSGLGSTFKSVLGANLVSSALMSGVSALTGGVKGAFSSAISEGAKLQQSIGGIETLFKGSAGKVKQYAQDAFRTAGLSANEYMENVTSFSASLIQSLGGDTQAAAELANTALKDMSDNANKMGSDMGMITQTYQSLARGNYQMLDNLKLGYGGTKAELQRLIKDSASYKDIQEELNMTVKEGDMSFANIVKAISVMQKKLDITGTTAKEASETFTGSFTSMKAAFKDFLGNLTTGGDIKKPLENLAKTAATFVFKNAVPMIANAFKALPKAISTFLASAKPEIEAGLKKMLPEATVNSIMKTFDNIGKFISGFKDTGALTAVAEAFNAVKDAIGHVFSSLAGHEGTFTTIGTALGEIVKWLAEAATKGAEFISSLPPGTIQTIASAVLGMVAAFKTVSTATKVINGLKTSFGLLKAALSNPWGLAIAGIGMLIGWFVQAYTTSETFRNKVNEIASVIGKVAGKIAEFVSGLDPSMFALIIPAIATLIAKFKSFSSLGNLNPFKLLKKNATDAFTGASGSATQSKGIIEQVFSGLGTLITSIAQGISTVLNGLATALSTVAQGFGQAAAMASPAQWLSMGAAMLMVGAGVALVSAGIYVLVQAAIQLTSAGSGAAIALAGLGVGIAALAGVFALLGPALTASAVGMVAFGAAVALIGAGIGMAAAGLAMLASQLPTIATYGASAASAILALSGAVVAFGAGVTVAGAGLLVLSAGLIAFGAAALVATAGGVALAACIVVVSAAVAAFGLALQPVASAVKKMGQGAKDAGTGTKQLASGLKSITSLPLGSLVTHLGAVAIGIGKISGKGGEIASVGAGMKQLGQGLTTIATSGMIAVTAMTVIGTAITQLSTQMTTLPATLTLAAAGFTTFSSQAVAGVAGLSAINAPIAMFKSQIMTITPALMMANASFTVLSSGVMVVGTALTMVSSGFAQVSSSAAGTSSQLINMATSTQLVITAFNAMRGQVQSSMQAILSIITSVGSQMKSQGSQIGQQTARNIAQGISGGIGQSTGAMQALMNAVRSVGMSGVGSMRGIGAMIGQGLAQGMYSALGAVTAAANALVAQAERAARAKAQIHSPSRLFRDSVGRFLPMGVAVGIEKNTKYVDKAMSGMYDNIQAFSYKAEDIIGVGKTKLSKVVQVKSDFENAIKAKVEVAKEKSNDLMEKALDVAEKAAQRPSELVLDDGTLIAKTGDKYDKYQTEQARRRNRMRGIIT